MAALAAAKRKDLAAVILQSGLYDLAGTVKDTRSEGLRQIVEAEAGPKSGWKSRSPLLIKALPSAPTLILHGEKDDAVPPSLTIAAAVFPQVPSHPPALPEQGHRLRIVRLGTRCWGSSRSSCRRPLRPGSPRGPSRSRARDPPRFLPPSVDGRATISRFRSIAEAASCLGTLCPPSILQWRGAVVGCCLP